MRSLNIRVWVRSKLESYFCLQPPFGLSSELVEESKPIINLQVPKYKSLGSLKAGELLLPPAQAILLAEELDLAGVLILGVDLWYAKGEEIAENPNCLDLSEITDVKASARLARDFIARRLPEKTAFVSLVWAGD